MRGERLLALRGQAVGDECRSADIRSAGAARRARLTRAAPSAAPRPAGGDNNRRSIRRGGAAARRSAGTSTSPASGRRRLSPTSSLGSRSASHATPSSWRGPERRDDDAARLDRHAVGHAIIERPERGVEGDDTGAGEGHCAPLAGSVARCNPAISCAPVLMLSRRSRSRLSYFPRFLRWLSRSRTSTSSSSRSRPSRRATS